MIKILILTIMFLAHSIAAKETIFVVEIADFKCKYCLEAESYTDLLRGEIKSNGDEFIFAPLSFNREDKVFELFYYSIKEDPALEKYLREQLFDLAQDKRLPIKDISELIEYLEIVTNPNSIDFKKIKDLILEDLQDFENVKSYLKASSLAKEAGVEQTPTFLIISSTSGITKVKRSLDMNIKEYIDQTIKLYQRITKNES